ncbi:hypothetical protein VTL71DRAFT_2197 [Oculimacula yallundae]|uniref:Uncharacterized protein n=1 Tax=Oculimacula yallundae TaxID=86028 RepID=A0ABR4C9I3_9HELO
MNNCRSRGGGRARPELSQNWRRPDPSTSTSATISNSATTYLTRLSNGTERNTNTNTICEPGIRNDNTRRQVIERDNLSRDNEAHTLFPRRSNVIENGADSRLVAETLPHPSSVLEKDANAIAQPQSSNNHTHQQGRDWNDFCRGKYAGASARRQGRSYHTHERENPVAQPEPSSNNTHQQVLDPNSFDRGNYVAAVRHRRSYPTNESISVTSRPESTNNNDHRPVLDPNSFIRGDYTTASRQHRSPNPDRSTMMNAQIASHNDNNHIRVQGRNDHNRETPMMPTSNLNLKPWCYKCHGKLDEQYVCRHCREDNSGKIRYVDKWLNEIDTEHNDKGEKIVKEVERATADKSTVAPFRLTGARRSSFELISLDRHLEPLSVSPTTATNLRSVDEDTRYRLVKFPTTDSRSIISINMPKIRRLVLPRRMRAARRLREPDHRRFTNESMEQTVGHLDEPQQPATVKLPTTDSRCSARFVSLVLQEAAIIGALKTTTGQAIISTAGSHSFGFLVFASTVVRSRNGSVCWLEIDSNSWCWDHILLTGPFEN